MVQGVSDYNLIPIKTYSQTSGKTTITSFEDMLQQTSLKQDVTQSSTDSHTAETSQEESGNYSVSADSQKADTVVFRNPVTGRRILYVDVATRKEKTDKTSGSSEASSASYNPSSASETTKYEAYFQKAAKKYDVSVSLLKAIAKAESNFNAKCVSSAGAMGVMQLMPATAEGLGVKDPYDPEQNILGGAKCIAAKLKEFDGDVQLALAAYNAGSGAVRRNGGIPSYTKSYISKVLAYQKDFEK